MPQQRRVRTAEGFVRAVAAVGARPRQLAVFKLRPGAGGALLRHPDTHLRLRERVFSQLFRCLSRACLGK